MASEKHHLASSEGESLFRGLFSQRDQHPEAVQDSSPKTSGHIHSVVEIRHQDDHTAQKPSSSTFRDAITKWSAMLTMSSCFLLGLFLAIGHHCYYKWLDGQVVGDSDRQQWALRFGSAFGTLVGAFLKIAVGCAYIQYVWLRLQQRNISLGALDATFDVLGNPWQLLKFEMVRFLNFAVVVIFISWCIPLSQIFPTATLSVRVHEGSELRPLEAFRPSLMYHGKERMSDGNWAPSLYYTNMFDDAKYQNKPAVIETWDRVSLDLILLANTVALGERVVPPHISFPYTNYTYSMSIYLPRLRCQPSNSRYLPVSESNISSWLISIDQMDAPKDTTFTFNMSNFRYNSTVSNSSHEGQITYLGLAEVLITSKEKQPPVNRSYTYDRRTIESRLARRTGRFYVSQYSVATLTIQVLECQIYNSTFNIDVAVNQGRSQISVQKVVDIGPVQIANEEDKLTDPANAFLDYWFQRVIDSVVGYVTLPRASTDMAYTPVVKFLVWDDFAPGFEELSINTSLSLMSNNGYCMPVMVNANFTTIQNVYDYRPQNLLISYGIVLIFTLMAVILGVFSFQRNGISYDNLVSTIGKSMQNPEVAKVLEDMPLGTTRIDPRVMDVRLRLGTYPTSTEGDNTSEHTRKLGFVPMIP